jgi:dynein heavy chain
MRCRNAGFVPWSDVVPPFKYNPNAPFTSVLVPTMDTVRYGKLLDTCYSIGKGVILVGPSGVGKSAIIGAQLAAARSSGHLTVTFHCSARTTSPVFRELMESKLVKRGSRYAIWMSEGALVLQHLLPAISTCQMYQRIHML